MKGQKDYQLIFSIFFELLEFDTMSYNFIVIKNKKAPMVPKLTVANSTSYGPRLSHSSFSHWSLSSGPFYFPKATQLMVFSTSASLSH